MMPRASNEPGRTLLLTVSAFGLAQQSEMTVREAKVFIDTYFKRYPGVKDYIDQTIAQVKTDGVVRTLYGRRRFFPEINSSHRPTREFAERTAINTPMQGTAADIIKKAMIDIDQILRSEKKRSVMILQVHDELVFDAHRSEVDWLADMVKEVMESAATLIVPLVAEIGIGPNWLDAK